jgi:hypothetical protein
MHGKGGQLAAANFPGFRFFLALMRVKRADPPG